MAEEKSLQVQEVEKQEVDQSEAERTRSGLAFVPRADIYETNDDVFVVCDMPGVDENSVDITLEKNVLSINGYVTADQPKNHSLAYTEYQVGDYYRRFSVSNEIDQERIEATVKDGVLRLKLPKVTPTTKRIAVKAV